MNRRIRESIASKTWVIIRRCGLGPMVLAMYPKSMLVQCGWFKSFRRGLPLDEAGRPLPWLTYSCIDFLETRLNPKMTLFEYGSGYSTIWYCSKVCRVVAVESNQKWAKKVTKLLPANGKVFYEQETKDYIEAIAGIGKVDVIVVDGICRQACYEYSFSFLSERGVIIAYDSERDDYSASWPKLQSLGFKELTFTGLTPGHFVKSQTSILYRQQNCLGI